MSTLTDVFKLLFAIFIFLLISCNMNSKVDTENIFERAKKTDSLLYYFPASFSDSEKMRFTWQQDMKQRRASSSLYSFKEPILYKKNDSQTIYRLLWFRSFHEPLCFSMKEYNSKFYMRAKMLNRYPAYYDYVEAIGNDEETGKVILDTIQKADRLAIIKFDTAVSLTKSEWNKIESYLTKVNFWNGPVDDPNTNLSSDGSSWIIEGRKNNKYHFIDRHFEGGELINFGKYLIWLCGMNIKKDAIY